ncbi:LysM peptidoglycan-binding domain-containing protein, partial [bacterium]|nr:LysM peptidoglycan-binding domain-containing protein [bacterium]
MIRKSLTLAVLAFAAFFTPLLASTNDVQAGFGHGCASFHTVQRGETLAHIARNYGFTTSELAALNGITNPNLIFVGQVLSIPGAGTSTPIVDGGSTDGGAAPAPSNPAPGGSSNVGGGFELGGQVITFSYPPAMREAGMTWVKIQHRYRLGEPASVVENA